MTATAPLQTSGGLADYLALGRGVVCFTWDDGFDSAATVGQLASARGQRHTFGIYSDAIDVAGRLTSSQILSLYNAGHEIANHSKTHAHIKDQTLANRLIEYETSRTAIEAIIGSGNCRTWVYPYGDGTSRDPAVTDQELYLRFDRIIATSSGRYVVRISDRDEVSVVFRRPWQPGTHNEVLQLIRLAAVRPVIVSVYGHDIDGADTITTEQMTEGLDLAQSLRVPCLTLAETFPGPGMLPDGGFEDSTLGAWAATKSDVNQTVESVAVTPASGMPGSRSLHLQTTSDTSYCYVTSVPIPTRPGATYTFSGRDKTSITSTGASAKIYHSIREHDVNGNVATSNIGSPYLTNTGWGSFTQSVTLASDTSFCTVQCVIENLTGQAWFDHLWFGLSSEVNLG